MRVYKDIEYRLKKSNRKTASIYVERDGSISVLVPDRFTKPKVEELVEKKRRWIYTHLAEWQDMNATRVAREFVNGEGFLYLGRSYRLNLVQDQEVPLMLKQGHFCLNMNYGRGPERNPKDIFKDFYRDRGNLKIPERVERYQGMMGVQAGGIRILDLKNRWASCSAKGVLNFHWKCMMAPLKILDYIVVHELAHRTHPRHNDAFWNEVDKVMPDYRERREWLKRNGAGMGL